MEGSEEQGLSDHMDPLLIYRQHERESFTTDRNGASGRTKVLLLCCFWGIDIRTSLFLGPCEQSYTWIINLINRFLMRAPASVVWFPFIPSFLSDGGLNPGKDGIFTRSMSVWLSFCEHANRRH